MTVADGFESASVADFEFLGEVTFETGFTFEGTEVGGLSGLAFDAAADSYFAISDDRGSNGDPRFYTLTIDLSDGALDEGDIAFTDVVPLLAEDGAAFEVNETDFEGIALTPIGTLAIASERNDLPGETGQPQVFAFSTAGEQLVELSIPDRYIPDAAFDAEEPRTQGVRNNLAFESLTITPNGESLFTATENALVQDGPESTVETNSLARILQFDTATDELVAEFFYEVEPVPNVPEPADGFSTNGLVELLALDNAGNFLALERAFSVGVGNTVRLFQVNLDDALGIGGIEALANADGEVVTGIFGAVEKTLILDVEADLGIEPDNLEALAFGPVLEDGRQSLIIASDNNFSDTQETQFLAVALDIELGEPNTLVNGVGSGDVSQDSVVLFARSIAPGDLTFEVSTDPEFAIDAADSFTIVETVTDTDIPVRTFVDGLLEPNTEYFYRVTDAAGDLETGRFVTAAEVGDRTGLTFGVSGDYQQAPPYPILNTAAESELDFFLQLGDTIFADIETPGLPDVSQASTLEEFRAKHDEILSPRAGLSAVTELYRSTANFATIDDHELVDNFAGGAAPGDSPDAPDIGSSDTPLFTDDVEFVNDTQAYEDALQAFQEFHPIRDEFFGDTGDDRTAGERQLYRFREFGSDAALFVLDSRSFRDAQLPPADLADPTEFLVNAFDPDRTLLGQAQLDLLFEDLLTAQENGVTWKFINIPEPVQNFGVVTAEDRFEGYAAERTEVLQFIDENDIDNVVFLAGDFHGTIVNNLTYQLGPGQEQIATNAFEVVTGPVGFFDGLFGPNVVALSAAAGLIPPEQLDFFNGLPVAPDPDNIVDDADDFVEQLLIAQTDLFGLDPVGLDNNLPQAEGLIDATLLQGDYVAGNNFSWAEFDIDAVTQELTVTVFGIDAFSEADILADPEAILALEPSIISQFVVSPQGFALAEEPLAELTGFAELPAETFAEGPPSGAAVDANGFTGPFIGQPVQGFSGVQFAPGSDADNDDTFLFLADNGFGGQGNSADFLLRLYEVTPDFETGEVILETNDEGLVTSDSFIQLSDPDNLIPFDIVNEDTEDRLLTGADFDIESFVIAENGDLIIGDEFGPFLLRFNSAGELIEAPIATPNITDVEGAAPFVLSPQNPEVLAGNAVANIGGSNGFEGLAFSPDRTTAFPLLEGAVEGDPEDALRIYEFDLETNEFADELVGFYQLEDPDFAIGDFTPINENEYLVIERDQLQGAEAAFKQVFKVDLSEVDENGFVEKELIVDLLNIDDPNDLNGDGETIFTFPFVTIEDVLVLDENTILVANDNNFPFSIGRDFSGEEIDNNEIIQLTLDEPLDLDPNIPFLVDDAPVVDDAPIFGTAGNDTVLGGVDTDADDDVIITGAEDDIIDLGLIAGDDVGENAILSGSGGDEISVTAGDRAFGGSGNDTLIAEDSLGGNRMSGGAGDDSFFLGADDRALGGAGDDTFFVLGGGNNILSGGTGSDVFVLIPGPGDLPATANAIVDFEVGTDFLSTPGLDFGELSFVGDEILVGATPIATLLGIDTSTLTAEDFTTSL